MHNIAHLSQDYHLAIRGVCVIVLYVIERSLQIRAKEAARNEAKMFCSPEDETRRKRMERLPEMARILRSYDIFYINLPLVNRSRISSLLSMISECVIRAILYYLVVLFAIVLLLVQVN